MTKREEIITNFVKSLDEEVSVTFFESMHGCHFNHGTKTLNIDFTDIGTEQSQFFFEHMIEKHGFKEAKEFDEITLTILHEIGHHINKHEGTNMMEMFFLSMIADQKEREYKYFDMKDEWEATEWAINFIKTKYAVVKLFEKELLTSQQ